MKKFDASFVGFVTLDVLGRSVDSIPEGGGIAFLEEMTMSPAGTVGGSVMNAAKLGANVMAVCSLGQDEASDYIMGVFTRLGIDTDYIQSRDKTPTSSTILPIRSNGDRPCLHCRGASELLFVDEKDFDAVTDAKIFHYAGHGFIGAMEKGQHVKLLRHAKQRGCITTFDLIGPHEKTLEELTPMLPDIDYFMPSMEEAEFLSGMSDPYEMAGFFMDLGVRNCIFKWGPKGSFIRTADSYFRLPAFKVAVSDTTGCGDSYCGGFIAGLAKGYDLEQACRLGTAASGLVASGLGSNAKVVDLDTTLDFMRTATILDA